MIARPMPVPPVPLRSPERPANTLDDIVSPITPRGGIREFDFAYEAAPCSGALGGAFAVPRKPVAARAPRDVGKNKPLPQLPPL